MAKGLVNRWRAAAGLAAAAGMLISGVAMAGVAQAAPARGVSGAPVITDLSCRQGLGAYTCRVTFTSSTAATVIWAVDEQPNVVGPSLIVVTCPRGSGEFHSVMVVVQNSFGEDVDFESFGC